MDVLGGAITLPFDVVQYIQDQDPDIHLHLVCKGIKLNQFKYSLNKLKDKKRVKAKPGSRASIMYAYSSGDPDHLVNCVRYRKINKYKNLYNIISAQSNYYTSMNAFKKLALVPSHLHYKYLIV